jgi:hypothetical protein
MLVPLLTDDKSLPGLSDQRLIGMKRIQVPQGRLQVAQDEILGRAKREVSSPVGTAAPGKSSWGMQPSLRDSIRTLTSTQDCVLGYLQSSLTGLGSVAFRLFRRLG